MNESGPSNSPLAVPNPVPLESGAGKAIAVTGMLCLFAPIVVFFAVVLRMTGEFSTSLQPGARLNDENMKHSIHVDLVSLAIALPIGCIGFVLVCLAIFGFRYRSYWLWRALFLPSALAAFVFPFGTVVSVLSICVLISTRRSFGSSPSGNNSVNRA